MCHQAVAVDVEFAAVEAEEALVVVSANFDDVPAGRGGRPGPVPRCGRGGVHGFAIDENIDMIKIRVGGGDFGADRDGFALVEIGLVAGGQKVDLRWGAGGQADAGAVVRDHAAVSDSDAVAGIGHGEIGELFEGAVGRALINECPGVDPELAEVIEKSVDGLGARPGGIGRPDEAVGRGDQCSSVSAGVVAIAEVERREDDRGGGGFPRIAIGRGPVEAVCVGVEEGAGEGETGGAGERGNAALLGVAARIDDCPSAAAIMTDKGVIADGGVGEAGRIGGAARGGNETGGKRVVGGVKPISETNSAGGDVGGLEPVSAVGGDAIREAGLCADEPAVGEVDLVEYRVGNVGGEFGAGVEGEAVEQRASAGLGLDPEPAVAAAEQQAARVKVDAGPVEAVGRNEMAGRLQRRGGGDEIEEVVGAVEGDVAEVSVDGVGGRPVGAVGRGPECVAGMQEGTVAAGGEVGADESRIARPVLAVSRLIGAVRTGGDEVAADEDDGFGRDIRVDAGPVDSVGRKERGGAGVIGEEAVVAKDDLGGCEIRGLVVGLDRVEGGADEGVGVTIDADPEAVAEGLEIDRETGPGDPIGGDQVAGAIEAVDL